MVQQLYPFTILYTKARISQLERGSIATRHLTGGPDIKGLWGKSPIKARGIGGGGGEGVGGGGVGGGGVGGG